MITDGNRPLVTVVTLVYKKYDRLMDTILSVLQQSYLNVEYIISDDGSADFPYNEINSIIEDNNTKHFQIKIFPNSENRGTVRHANFAYKNAEGKYIINLSCGDIFFDENVVSKIVDRFEKKKCDVMVTSRIQYTGSLTPICLLPHREEWNIIQKFNSIEGGMYKALILDEFYDAASGSAMHYSKVVMEKYNYFDENYRLWEDGPFIAKYSFKNKIETAYDIISIWYQSGGVSSKDRNEINSILLEDMIKFNNNERLEHLHLFDKKEIKRIMYRNERARVRVLKDRFRLYLKFFPQVIYYVLLTHKRKINKKKDMDYIRQIIKERDDCHSTKIHNY